MSCIKVPEVDLPELPSFGIRPPALPPLPSIPAPFPCCTLPDVSFPPLPASVQAAIDAAMVGISLVPAGANVLVEAMEAGANLAIAYINAIPLKCPKNFT
jgi:hypothetical protein